MGVRSAAPGQRHDTAADAIGSDCARVATGTDTGGAIYLITGPMAAGKSSVAGLLAKRFTRAVHLEGDLFRRSILSGREEMSPEPSSEAIAQLRLRYRLAAVAADVYHGAGFTVAVEDVVGGAFLREYIALIRSRPLHVVVLVPSFEALAAREAGREQKGYLRWQIAEHRTRFLAETPRIGLWFDSSDQVELSLDPEVWPERWSTVVPCVSC